MRLGMRLFDTDYWVGKADVGFAARVCMVKLCACVRSRRVVSAYAVCLQHRAESGRLQWCISVGSERSPTSIAVHASDCVSSNYCRVVMCLAPQCRPTMHCTCYACRGTTVVELYTSCCSFVRQPASEVHSPASLLHTSTYEGINITVISRMR